MSEARMERFCEGCVAKAAKTDTAPVCIFKQNALNLLSAVEAEKKSKKPHPVSPAQRFSTLMGVARNTLNCPQIPEVCKDTGAKLNPRLATGIGIKISPNRPRDQAVDYLTFKARKDRNRT